MEPFVSSRFLIRDRPLAYPYYDLILQDTAGPVFDLGVDMESYDGAVYVHVDHIVDMGRTLGMATKEEVANLMAIIETLSSKINRVDFAQEDLKIGIDNLVSQFHARINTVDPVPSVDSKEPAEDNRKPAEADGETVGPLVL